MSLIAPSFFDDFLDPTSFIIPASPSGKQLVHHHDLKKLAAWPKMDLLENDKANTLSAIFELPGLKREDIHIQHDPERCTVTVSGSAEHSEEYKEGNFKRSERTFGSFSRTFPVQFGIKDEEIKASLEHGVLKVVAPKRTGKSESSKIPIA